MFACVFRHTGAAVHMLARSAVHFTRVLCRQPCKEITSASVVLLHYNKGRAAGGLLLLVCVPLVQTTSPLQCSVSQIVLVSSAASLLPAALRRDAKNRITESLRLEKTSQIPTSNPSTAPTDDVPQGHVLAALEHLPVQPVPAHHLPLQSLSAIRTACSGSDWALQCAFWEACPATLWSPSNPTCAQRQRGQKPPLTAVVGGEAAAWVGPPGVGGKLRSVRAPH